MNKKKPLRHSTESSYKKGDSTRKNILDSALKVFAEKGFDAATTRLIASKAGVNPPALQSYFENKEGVFISCAEKLVEENISYFMPLIEIAKSLDSTHDISEHINIIYNILEAILERIFTVSDFHYVQLFLSRTQLGQGPQSAFDIIYDKLDSPLHDAVSGLVAIISNLPLDNEKVHLRTLSLFGLIGSYLNQRRSVMAKLNWKEIDECKLALLKEVMREDCMALIRSWQREETTIRK